MEIYLEKCTIDNFEEFYFLRCDDENLYWTGYKNKPIKENLKIWYINQLKREDRIIFLAKNKANANTIGYLYLDIVGENKNICETGHGVHSKFKGRGIGTEIIRMALEYVNKNLNFISRVDGWILENNKGSIKTVLKNGYFKTDEVKKVFLDSTNKLEILRKYSYKISR